MSPREVKSRSYYEDDLVVCVLRGGFSRVCEVFVLAPTDLVERHEIG